MQKLLKDTRGVTIVELLWVLPVLFMIFLFIIESSIIMYDFAVVNYFTSTAAEKAAMEGCFNDTIRQSLLNNLKWTSNGKTYSADISGTSPNYSPGVIVIYGTDKDTQIQRGNDITVGTVYPVQFKTFIIRGAFQWVVEQMELTLKAQAVSTSEKYF